MVTRLVLERFFTTGDVRANPCIRGGGGWYSPCGCGISIYSSMLIDPSGCPGCHIVRLACGPYAEDRCRSIARHFIDIRVLIIVHKTPSYFINMSLSRFYPGTSSSASCSDSTTLACTTLEWLRASFASCSAFSSLRCATTGCLRNPSS